MLTAQQIANRLQSVQRRIAYLQDREDQARDEIDERTLAAKLRFWFAERDRLLSLRDDNR